MRFQPKRLLVTALLLALAPIASATTWYVNGVSGSDSNDCTSVTTACKTIGHAISLASSGDTIRVGPATYTENLTISFSLKVIGAGARTTIIDGGGVNTVITIPNITSLVALSNLTIQNGSANTGAGIFNAGTMSINRTTISANAVHLGSSPRGGGIENGGTMMISNSTLTGNIAFGLESGAGGGIYNDGTLTISNSTLTANTAIGGDLLHNGFAQGGGIDNIGALTISNSTLSGNSVSGKAGAFGGGINNGGKLTMQNTIVANSPSGGNCSGTMTSNGYNLSSDGSCNFNGPGDLNNTDPMLGALGNNGGPTKTIPEILGSPTVDAGNPSGCTDAQGHLLKTDQRGFPRPGKDKTVKRCDMGAYERQSD